MIHKEFGNPAEIRSVMAALLEPVCKMVIADKNNLDPDIFGALTLVNMLAYGYDLRGQGMPGDA